MVRLSVLAVVLLSALPSTTVATYNCHDKPQVVRLIASVAKLFAPVFSYAGLPGFHLPANGTLPEPAPEPAAYWLADIAHRGLAPFAAADYRVFRNVKDFGAAGDGIMDDTAAINRAISAGSRCGPQACLSSTVTPALVYFPAGTYLISGSIVDFYYTQLVGNPNCLPVLKATSNFTGFGLIDGDRYGANGLAFGGTNVFFRQIRNFVFDMTAIPAAGDATCIHWPTAQATSIQNCVFRMSDAPGTKHLGIFIEEGSGGFMNDLVFYGGYTAVFFGNQQFTMRNLTFYNAVTAIYQLWDWGWTYTGVSITNCSIGLDMSNGGAGAQAVGSVTLIDSSITDTPLGILTAYNATSQPSTGGSLVVENVQLKNVSVAIQGPGSTTVLAGSPSPSTIAAWGQGHAYTPTGPSDIEGPIAPFPRPGSLLVGGKFYARSKPQYAHIPVTQFLSVRAFGAKGDGVTDDSAALNRALAVASSTRQIVFFDAGIYLVTCTIVVPPRSKIVGEAYPMIMGSGAFFSDMSNPQPVVSVGGRGDRRSDAVEWSDMVVSTQGATAGAVLIEWNLDSSEGVPSGMWDVHTRIGGFTGSNLQVAQCPKTPTQNVTGMAGVNASCIAAFMSMHVTKTAASLYLENVWLWTADHDLDDPALSQITIYAGRGLYIESEKGNIWLVGTAVEHHVLYQYQLYGTSNAFMGQIQTETAYYQPNPVAKIPFPVVPALHDPDFEIYCARRNGTCAAGFGLRVLESSDVLVYGAGLYSFFSNYNTHCSSVGAGATCQTQIFEIHTASGPGTCGTYVYNLNTIGATSMIDLNGASVARYSDNLNTFQDTVAVFRTG